MKFFAVEIQVLFGTMHVAVRVPVDVPGGVAFGPLRSMREFEIMTLVKKLEAVAHEVPTVLGIPLNAFLIMIAAHEYLGDTGINSHHYLSVHFFIVAYANVPEMNEHIIPRVYFLYSLIELFLPIARTTTPFFEARVIEMCIAYQPVVHVLLFMRIKGCEGR